MRLQERLLGRLTAVKVLAVGAEMRGGGGIEKEGSVLTVYSLFDLRMNVLNALSN